jgi:hypothetical protein
MLYVLGRAAIAVVVFMGAVHAVFVLVSPRAWLRLSSGLLLNGSMTRRKHIFEISDISLDKPFA